MKRLTEAEIRRAVGQLVQAERMRLRGVTLTEVQLEQLASLEIDLDRLNVVDVLRVVAAGRHDGSMQPL